MLKEVLIEALPNAYRQTLIHLDETTGELRDLYARQALPYLIKFSGAGRRGGRPSPALRRPPARARHSNTHDHPAGQPLWATAARSKFHGVGRGVGMGMAVQKAFVRFLPFLGSMVGNAAGWAAATFALGKACCYYFSSIRAGHVPRPEELKQYYQHSVHSAQETWRKKSAQAAGTA